MNLGLLFPFRNPPQWRVDWPEFYAEQLRQIQVAEDLGYDTAWLTEHHFAEDGYAPSLLPIAANVAARTRQIRIGTFLILLPLHNALRVAEDAATVDILSNGRLDLGFGQGYAPNEFEGFGISRRERASRLREGVEVVRGAFTQSPFSYSGKHYQIKDIELSPPPVQSPHPPIWVGARAPTGVKRAARLGCHFLGTWGPALQELYDQTLVEEGRDPANFGATQLHFTYVAATREQAFDDCQEHLHYLLTWYSKWATAAADIEGDPLASPVPPASELRNLDPTRPNAPMVGTPDDVARLLLEHTSASRTTHIVLCMHMPGLAPDKTQRSMELFAKEVASSLRH